MRKFFLSTLIFASLFMSASLRAQGLYEPPVESREMASSEPAFADIAAAPLLHDYDILAYYGHPNSRQMGILGRYSKEELHRRLTDLAAQYDAVNGDRKMITAFYLIYGTVHPQGKIGIMKDELLQQWIDFALEHEMLVFIDHQIGQYDPVASVSRMFRWLEYPNVHLAFDPEWRTTRPMQVIGSVTGQEINNIQAAMQQYMDANNIPGERLLVTHQFKPYMIRQREQVTTDFERVRLVHCTDGFGGAAAKKSVYAANAKATNIPVKSFKLFYNFGIQGAGYDIPLMTPGQVMSLSPAPRLVMYQ